MSGERARRPVLLALAVVAAAIGLGVIARWAAGAGLIAFAGPVAEPAGRLSAWAIALGAPWLAVAWVLGTLARSLWGGALTGAAALVGGTAAWYAVTVYRQGYDAVDYAVSMSIGWASAAVVAGAVFGAAGTLWRRGPSDVARAVGAAVLAGALIGESVLLVTQWDGRAARVVLTVELLAGIVLPALLLRRHRNAMALALVLTAAVALVAAGAEHLVRDALRDAGWGGR